MTRWYLLICFDTFTYVALWRHDQSINVTYCANKHVYIYTTLNQRSILRMTNVSIQINAWYKCWRLVFGIYIIVLNTRMKIERGDEKVEVLLCVCDTISMFLLLFLFWHVLEVLIIFSIIWRERYDISNHRQLDGLSNNFYANHYNDAIARWRLKSPASCVFTQPLIKVQFNENIKAPHHWPFVRGIHIWWHHHDQWQHLNYALWKHWRPVDSPCKDQGPVSV